MSGTASQTIRVALEGWFNAAVSFLYPALCQFCKERRAGPAEGYVCAECAGKVRWIREPQCARCGSPVDGAITGPFECASCVAEPPAYTWARAAVAAEGIVRDAIHRYKYQRALWVEGFLAGLLVSQAGAAVKAARPDWLVPVPLHPCKERDREFNQAERLARRLSRATGIPLNTRLIQRTVHTPSQTHLSRKERQTNMRRAFRLWGGVKLHGERIVLIDDVLTTGSTCGACARVLLRGGASEVWVWTVARGLGV